jgi:hypothetical protein
VRAQNQDVLQSAEFTYYSDDQMACTFWSDMHLNFGSGLSVNLLFTPVGFDGLNLPQKARAYWASHRLRIVRHALRD